ncbi:structural maintenance of chromosomes protein 4 isoform X2 [Harpegnathos saltator]|uniref:structural maintenance of chromosomes protein 4 isoform X2 n=1 Tax=Harpegnathos saltator TaxID=610380 RepID=UPI00058F029F|nr:structural maintenance of chromosomes protein 4 isoform X2 [Harpegnathos saltator]
MASNARENSNISINEDMEVNLENMECDVDEEGGLRVDDEIYIPPAPTTFREVDTNGPRLMISKIVNKNFKSYAASQMVGPFHKHFSAIVGPNGSGKSNVIDSMLFVFGYRASKIRSKNISVLIHSSSQHANLDSCTVSIHFQRIIDQPGDEYEVVPDSEFVISRTAFKDNSSYYEINKKKVQFKEIAKLLRSYGVDLDHNRFLILQGEVEQIAMMKPKGQTEHDTGMLEYLEDIIGTFRYKEPLQKLNEKVEILTELRMEKLHRLRIVQKEKQALEEPMQKAVQYLKAENDIISLQHQLYHCQRHEAKKELAEHTAKNDTLDKELATLVNEMKSVHIQKEEKIKIIKEENKKWDELQQQKDDATAVFDKVRKEDESLHAELVETNKRRKAHMTHIKTEKGKLEEYLKIPEKNIKDIQEYEHLVDIYVTSKEKEEASLVTLMAELKEKAKPLLNERSKLEKHLILLRKNVNQAKAEHDIAQSELELYTSVEKVEKNKLNSLRETIERNSTTIQERLEGLSLLTTKIPATESNLNQTQSEMNKMKAHEVEMTARLKKLRVTFEEQRSAMQTSRSQNRILDSLMREKREGRIPGIFGRLGDLGAIDAKYDVAVSTACGPLDNIVVDTMATAQACVTFLRQNDIGRATFIPLEKQQRFLSRCSRSIDTPENVPRLFDLIRVEDKRVLPAFYYGLQDTLVAQDLDQATRIAYGRMRYRVVTLKGELVELSGTMSGGGRTVLRGRMGQKVVSNEPSNADIERLQSELDTVFKECNEARARQHTLENQIYVLTTELKNLRVNERKFSIELNTLREQEPALQAQLKEQERKVAKSISDPKRVTQLEKAVQMTKSNMDEVKQSSAAVEKEVECINHKINDISGNRVRDQQTKITKLNTSLEKTKAEICRLQVTIKTAERNVKKTEKNIEGLEGEVQTCEQRLRDIQQQKSKLEEHARAMLDELKELNEALKRRDEMTFTIKEEVNALQAREDQMKAVKIDLDQKLYDSKKLLKELQQVIPEYNRKIANLKLRTIPNETEQLTLNDLAEEEVLELDVEVATRNLHRAKKKLPPQMPNMNVIKDYHEKDSLYISRAADLEKVTVSRNRIRDIYETARRNRAQEFVHGFSLISMKLKEMYQMMTLGGDAELELVDSLDPFSEGVVLSVRPPKKSWKNIENLSGGEKTLSSLALVFALHYYKPSPLYFMDEIDAALDFKNVSIIGNYIKERTKNTQFIVISLRSNMFELADYLVGIYKTHNCSHCVTLNVAKFCKKNGVAPPMQLTSRNAYASQPGTQKPTSQRSCPTATSQKEKIAQEKTSSVTTNNNANGTQNREQTRIEHSELRVPINRSIDRSIDQSINQHD